MTTLAKTKRTATEIGLSSFTDAELITQLRDSLSLSAKHIERAAEIWMELERRGIDLTPLKVGINEYLGAIGRGRLLPDALFTLAGNKVALAAFTRLDVREQKKLMATKTVKVVRHDGIKDVPITALTASDVSRAFDPVTGKVVSVKDQKPVVQRLRAIRTERVSISLTEAEHTNLLAAAAREKKLVQELIITVLRRERLLG
jgi:hypothetical protein